MGEMIAPPTADRHRAAVEVFMAEGNVFQPIYISISRVNVCVPFVSDDLHIVAAAK